MDRNSRGRIQRRAGLNLGWAVRVLVLVGAIFALSHFAFAQESAPSKGSASSSPASRRRAVSEAFEWTAVGSFLCDCASAVGLGNLRLVARDSDGISITVIPTEETRATWRQLRALLQTIERAGAGLALTELTARAAPEEARDGGRVKRWKFDATVTGGRRAAAPSAFEGLFRVLRAISDAAVDGEVITEAIAARSLQPGAADAAQVEVRMLLLSAGPEALVIERLESVRLRIASEPWCCDATFDRPQPLRGGGWWAELDVRVRVDDQERESFAPSRIAPPGASNER